MHRLGIVLMQMASYREFFITLYKKIDLYSIQFMLALHSIFHQISRVFTRVSASCINFHILQYAKLVIEEL
jgi:hypothetical protein